MEEFTEEHYNLGRKEKRQHNKRQRGQMKNLLKGGSIEDLEEEFFDEEFDDLTEENV